MPETMVLIAGRSSKQGTSLNVGKFSDEYQEVTTTLEMNVDDMARLGLNDGDGVRLRTAIGEALVRCQGRKAEDLPSGLLFMAYGPASSQLMDSETQNTGMPISKNLTVEVEPVDLPEG
jgi:formylmethanofuran dehydrogenase subunit D